MEIVKGDIFELALNGEFDVITHGCNCQCKQKSGVAKGMVEHFGTDKFRLEKNKFKGDIRKLGSIDYEQKFIHNNKVLDFIPMNIDRHELYVVNSYTQFFYGTNHPGGTEKPLDYEALTLCLRKINYTFKDLKTDRKTIIGLPYLIGCGLAGGNEEKVLKIIESELKDLHIILVDKDGKVK